MKSLAQQKINTSQLKRQMGQNFKIEKARDLSTCQLLMSFIEILPLIMMHLQGFFDSTPKRPPQPVFPNNPPQTHLATGKLGMGNGAVDVSRDFCRVWRRFTGLNLRSVFHAEYADKSDGQIFVCLRKVSIHK